MLDRRQMLQLGSALLALPALGLRASESKQETRPPGSMLIQRAVPSSGELLPVIGMGVERFDLIAIHNLKDWRTHLQTLKQWKADGKVAYIGITTSHGRYHSELLEIMRKEPLDFVQFSYNIEDRTAEQALLPLAQDRGIATMINRPYQRGSLFARSKGQALPDVAADLGCNSWGQFYLKFILGHPAATCIIPATSNPGHMSDNMQANFGRAPDTQQRDEMLRVFQAM